ncbi:MAG: DUF296 domain-containing protein [bacterium]
MRWAKPGAFYQLRLEPGEEVIGELVGFVRRHRLGSGIISGLGAADEVEIGLYDLKKRSYVRRVFRGDWEVLALSGNIAWAGAEPVCHVHCVIGDAKMTTRGGHLYRARVSVTGEIAIIPGSRKLARELDERTGLKLLKLRR